MYAENICDTTAKAAWSVWTTILPDIWTLKKKKKKKICIVEIIKKRLVRWLDNLNLHIISGREEKVLDRHGTKEDILVSNILVE